MADNEYISRITNQKPSLDKANENSRWYLVQTQSNCEAKAISNIAVRAVLNGVEDKIEQMFFPVIEKKVRSVGGKEKIKKEKLYSNYIFVLADMDEAVYETIKHSDKISGFVQGTKTVIAGLPKPISPLEVKKVIENITAAEEGVLSTDKFKVGDVVRIKSGAFLDTIGNIDTISGDKIVVNVTVFGREAPINLTKKDIEIVKD